MDRRKQLVAVLEGLKEPELGDHNMWMGCLEVEIATAKGFQILSIQDGTKPKDLKVDELLMLVDDPTPWDELEDEELEEWIEKLGLEATQAKKSPRKPKAAKKVKKK